MVVPTTYKSIARSLKKELEYNRIIRSSQIQQG